MEIVLVAAVGLALAPGAGLARDTPTFQFACDILAGIGRHCLSCLPIGEVTDANQPHLTCARPSPRYGLAGTSARSFRMPPFRTA